MRYYVTRFAAGAVLGFTIINGVAAMEPVPRDDTSRFRVQGREPLSLQVDPSAASALSIFPQGIRVLRHDLLVDVPRDQAVFELWFSARPDLLEFDQHDRQRDSFQHFVQILEFGDFYRAGDALPQRPMLIVRGEEVHSSGKVVVREVDPLFDPADDPQSGGWGPKVAEVPLRQEGRRIRFSVPLSVFDHEDGFQPYAGHGFGVHYFLETYTFGTWFGGTLQGLATVASTDATIVVAPKAPNAPIHPMRKGPLVVDLITRPHEYHSAHVIAERVDPKSVRFGPNKIRPFARVLKDMDGDGYLDLRLWFTTAKLGLGCLDNELWLIGEQWDGVQRSTFAGFDTVRIARCRSPGRESGPS